MNYKDAGVDIEKGDAFAEGIGLLAASTLNDNVIHGIGGFGALYQLNMLKYEEPVIVSGTDGVGTKLKLAFISGKHDTVGIDLVAMCVNDIITCGADPLFFLDYFATGKLAPETGIEVMKGIVEGCKQAECALIGGETAEMPGFYANGEYDIAGFAVGAVDKRRIIDGSKIEKGDIIIGVESSGLHSNGFSLVRRLLEPFKVEADYLSDLLTPTYIYAKAVKAVKDSIIIKGMAHITGGGLDNISRVIPKGLEANIDVSLWEMPKIFTGIQKLAGISTYEMLKTFNCGIGYTFIVDRFDFDYLTHLLKEEGFNSFKIGDIV